MKIAMLQSMRLMALICSALIAAPASAAETYTGNCSVRFDGDSTLHKFFGTITNFPILVTLETNAQSVAVLNTVIEIKPRQLSTQNKKRDANMYDMFKEDKFPKLLAIVTNAPLAEAKLTPSAQSNQPGKLPVQFIFCGISNKLDTVTHPIATLTEGWEFELETVMSLKSFKLEPPGALFGAISVKDDVLVKAHVKVIKEPPRN